MGRISDIICFGKADSNQIAYSGYKDNIEAFLFATAMKQKISIATGHFPIPKDYVPTVPLPLPRTLFQLSKKPTKEFVEKMKGALEGAGITEVFVGKGNPSFVLTTPEFATLTGTIISVSNPRGPVIEGTAQLEAAIYSLRILQCIDLFLRTNTYSYRIEDPTIYPEVKPEDHMERRMEIRTASYWYRHGYDKKTKVPRRADEGTATSMRLSDEEPEDLTPHLSGVLPVNHIVLVAKPSTKPATTSYGAPSDVPFVHGILFPYFSGLLGGDSAGFRELVSTLFFRNLGELGKDVRDSFKEFRSGMGSFPTTTSGVIFTHVLKGIHLALQTQTQLFLLIEEKTYHGFCLLGENFSVFAHGGWTKAQSPEDLKKELSTIRSHSSSLSVVREIIEKCKDREGDMIQVGEDGLTSTSDLADLLAKIDLKENDDEQIEVLRKEIRTLSFPSRYRTFKPEYIADSIRQLTVNLGEPFPRDLPVYISPDWSKMGSKTYKIFASFGPRSFSFRNATGIEIMVPGEGDEDPMARRNEAGKLIYPRLLVGEKSLPAAIQEWETLVARGMIKMDIQERAQGSRNHVFIEKSRDTIWAALKDAKKDGFLGTGQVVTAEKRKADVAFGKADFESVVW